MDFFILSSWIFAFSCILPQSNSANTNDKCPLNCICYPDILSNLASWDWIENDIHSNPDDPDDKDFNPYTEHNEVYENPRTVNHLRNAETYHTVTCILRNDSPMLISDTFSQIPTETQVLSLIQSAGSGNITLSRAHLEPLTELIGIDIQGYRVPSSDLPNRPSSFRLAADALLPLHRLTYLSLDNVLLHQRPVEEALPKYTSRIVSIRKAGTPYNSTYEGNEVLSNLESQLIFLSPQDKTKEPIVPYSVYKNRHVTTAPTKTEAKAKPPEPKVAVAFTGIPSLLHLRISECNMQDISWDMFHQLQSLKFLLLERNDLLFLPDFVFWATSNLTALSLSGNRILSLETVGLAGLLYLQKLDMTYNNITHLSELSLPPFPHLEVADFRYNPIEAIYPNTFEVMNTTRSLYLGNPRVALQIFPNSFFGLASLLNLEIKNIRIGFLERPMFKGLVNLKSLTMDGQIPRISYDAFSEVPSIEKLVLKNCKIEKISMDAFIGLSSLLELDLSHNRITFLPPAIFDDQASLREIHLQHNQLTTLTLHLFSKTPIKMIRLEGNPWHCSCDMANWDPRKINQVRSYYVPKNETLCRQKYYGCSPSQQAATGFRVKYVYEKRVSPSCETPKKFNQRNVFDVMRKELQYCSASLGSNSSTLVKMKTKFGKGLKSAAKLMKTHGRLQGTKPEKMKKPALENVLTTEAPRMVTEYTTEPNPPTTIVTVATTLVPVVSVVESTMSASANSTEVPDKKLSEVTVRMGHEEDDTKVNDIALIPVPIPSPSIVPVPVSLKTPFQFNSLKFKPKSGTTPPPLKSRSVLTPPKQKSKKAWKLAKLYEEQKREQERKGNPAIEG